jgi:hypothetical protein
MTFHLIIWLNTAPRRWDLVLFLGSEFILDRREIIKDIIGIENCNGSLCNTILYTNDYVAASHLFNIPG